MFLPPCTVHPTLLIVLAASALTSCLSEEIVAVSDAVPEALAHGRHDPAVLTYESISFADQKKALRGKNSVILPLKSKKFTGDKGFSPPSSETGNSDNGPNPVPAMSINAADFSMKFQSPPSFYTDNPDPYKQSAPQLHAGEGEVDLQSGLKCALCQHNPCWWNNPSFMVWEGVGWWQDMPHQVYHNTLSYVWIPQGLYFQYWDDPGFEGWNNCFSASTMSLNLNMGGHDDAVGSIEIGYASNAPWWCRVY
jgi:hypothetical protein